MMKVSIITSCFNRSKTIRDCIESVLCQDYDDIEYIVVDGASTDNSMDIINEYKDRISKIINESDHGMYEAINKGIKVATGDIIGLMHSDDEFYDNHIVSLIVDCFQKKETDFIYGDGIFVDFTNKGKIIRNWISGGYSKLKVRMGWLPLHPTCYIRRDVMVREGLYDESYKIAADTDLLVRYLYKANLRIHYLHKYIVKMRMGGLSTDSTRRRQMWNEDIRLYRAHGFHPYLMKLMKMSRKVPQFIKARLVI